VPGVAVTGYGMPDEIDRCIAAGFSRHLLKPISVDQLGAAIADAIQGE